MTHRMPVASALLFAVALTLTACSSSAPIADTPEQEGTHAETPAADDTSSTESTDDATTDLSADLAADLEALMPGLGSADQQTAQDICGMLSLGTDRQTIELTAAGEYADYVEGNFIDGDQAKQIVDAIEPFC